MNGREKERSQPLCLMTWFFGQDSPEFRGFKDCSLHGIVEISPGNDLVNAAKALRTDLVLVKRTLLYAG